MKKALFVFLLFFSIVSCKQNIPFKTVKSISIYDDGYYEICVDIPREKDTLHSVYDWDQKTTIEVGQPFWVGKDTSLPISFWEYLAPEDTGKKENLKIKKGIVTMIKEYAEEDFVRRY